LVPNSDMETLDSFDTHGRVALTAYLRMDTPQHRDSAYDEFLQQMQARLDECGAHDECREAIREDMDIVKVYLETNGHRRHAGLAIFSCAAELFWRAYTLSSPIPTLVTVGPGFNLGPLKQNSVSLSG
jgi:hypothetical protein